MKYWLQVLKRENFEIIKNQFKNKRFNLFSFEQTKPAPEDIFIIYCKSSNTNESGFVSYGSFLSNFKLNETKYKPLLDKNICKYCADIKNIYVLKSKCKKCQVQNVFDTECNIKFRSFERKYMSKPSTFINISEEHGEIIISVLVKRSYEVIYNDNELTPKEKLIEAEEIINDIDSIIECNKYSYSESELDSDEERLLSQLHEAEEIINDVDNVENYKNILDDSTDKISISSCSSDDSNESKQNNIIPILFIPCKNYDWENNVQREFEKHYKLCRSCDKTNNNNIDVYDEMDDFYYDELYDEGEIDKYLEYYFNLRPCNLRVNDNLHVFKIDNENHDYHDSFLVF